MTTKTKMWAFFSVYSVLVIGFALAANPSWRRVEWPKPEHFTAPPIYPTIFFQGPSTLAEKPLPLSEYRGPQHWGQSEMVKDFNWHPVWHVPLNVGVHGASKSTPAVDNTGIYVGSDTGWFFKFDFSGQKIWDVYVGDAMRGIHGTALLDQDSVYFGAYNGTFYCLDKMSGRLRYLKKMGSALGASPVLQDGFLYLAVEKGSADGYLVKLRARDGQSIWNSDWLGEQSHTTVTLDLASQTAIIAANNNRIFGFDLQTGQRKWLFDAADKIKVTAPLIKGRVLYGAWDGKMYSIEAATGQVHYAQKFAEKIMSSVTYDSETDIGYVGAGPGLVAFKAETGEILWHVHGEFKDDSVKGSALILRDHRKRKALAVVCSQTEFCLVDAQNGKVLSKVPVGSVPTSTPVFYQNRVYVATDTTGLWAFDFNSNQKGVQAGSSNQ